MNTSDTTVSRAAFNRVKDDLSDARKEIDILKNYANSWTTLVNQCQCAGYDLDVGYRKNLASELRNEEFRLIGTHVGTLCGNAAKILEK